MNRSAPRPGPRALIALLTVGIACSLAPATAAAHPRLRLIATGGTIANHVGGRLSAAALADSVPDLDQVARIEPETFTSRASLALTLDDWLRLSRRIRSALDDPGLAGVIVTSGTDTLEELAYFLDLSVPTGRPVVVTGAMRRPGTAEADGPVNLLAAAHVAVSADARGYGVLVVFGGTIHTAREVRKVSTTALEAFASGEAGPVGRMEGGEVRFLRPGRTRDRSPGFDLSSVRRLPRVDVVLTYQQAPGDLIDAAIAGGARGIVVAAAGAGALTRAQAAAIRTVLRRGIPVVVTSRVAEGQVTLQDRRRRRLLIGAGDLPPLKARILLMVALAVDPRAVPRAFQDP